MGFEWFFVFQVSPFSLAGMPGFVGRLALHGYEWICGFSFDIGFENGVFG